MQKTKNSLDTRTGFAKRDLCHTVNNDHIKLFP